MTALTVIPQELGADDHLPPWGYLAHPTGHDDPDLEIAFPSGTWIQPPAGRYRVWVEGDWKISPLTHVIAFSPRPFQGSGMITAAGIVEAGRVTLPPDFRRGNDGLSLRLLHGGNYLVKGYPRWELSRRKPIEEVGEGLLMPVGLTLGAIWNASSESYVALSRPFEVRPRKTMPVPLDVPRADEAYLVAQIQRVSLARDADELKLKILLSREGRFVRPDFQVSTADRAYAVWYGLKPGPAVLRAEVDNAVLAARGGNHAAAGFASGFPVAVEDESWCRSRSQDQRGAKI